MLDISPGLMVWTLINFAIFFLLLRKLAWKPMLTALKNRETKIQESLEGAERAQAEAARLIKENEAKLAEAQQKMMDLVRDGRAQAEAAIQKATEEAERIKVTKLEEARAEIEREKQAAMNQLRNEVSSLVIVATEKILRQQLDADKQRTLVESVLQDFARN